MKLKPLYLILLLIVLAVTAAAPFVMPSAGDPLPTEDVSVMAPTEPVETSAQPATEPVTEAPTEPEPVVYTLSFVGDCTFGGTDAHRGLESSFISVVGEDYDYPFANVRHIFEADDFTMANLEGPLTEEDGAMEKQFAFRGPTAYTAIMTGSSVEAVNTSNNHFYDYGEAGMRSTRDALDAAGIAHAWRGTFLYTTDSGLTIGVYCDDFSFEKQDMVDSFAALREQGAEVIVCAFHWGEEKSYTPTVDQTLWGHIAIDAGADIVYGHHPHVLQPIEYYGNGVIFYSLGNFSFGGNTWATDMDTAILQQQFVREADGSLAMGETIIVPCSISSASGINNYQPTPLEEGSAAWDRVMQKLEGTYR